MADVHSEEVRSYNMSRIKSKNTKPELIVRKALFAEGFRYRLHVKSLPGKPDIVLKKHKTAILIHGCFWHGHDNCKYYVLPKTRTKWWSDKIDQNKNNDEKSKQKLVEIGWNVIEIFECELKKDKIEMTLKNLFKKIKTKKHD